MPQHWGGTVPPVPTCERCGARAMEPYGAIIPMRPAPRKEPLDCQGLTLDPKDWIKGKTSS